MLRFSSLLFTALASAPALAHLLELPNKIDLPAAQYLLAQQLYRGWALLGVVVWAALLSTLMLTLALGRASREFRLALAAFLCVAGAHSIFWLLTYPANTATANWTMLPENWEALRRQWEYSHAAGAVLNLAALIMLILSVTGGEE